MFEIAIRTTMIYDRKNTSFPVVDIVVVGIRRSQAETKYQWAA